MPECCGKYRSTNFCPDCGRVLLGDPLRTLLRYLTNQVERAEARLKRYEEEGFKRGLPGKRKIVEKWTAWRDAVSDIGNQPCESTADDQ